MGFGSLETKKKNGKGNVFFFLAKISWEVGFIKPFHLPLQDLNIFTEGSVQPMPFHFGGIIRLKFDRAVM